MFFRLSSLRRCHERQRATGRAGSRPRREVWSFDRARPAGALGFARFAPLSFVNSTRSCYKKRPRGAAASAERTAREETDADHGPSARWCPGHYQGGMVGALKCTNGPYCGPGTATAKWAQMDLARGFARGLPPDDDPDRDHGIFNARLRISMVALVCVGEGRWVSGSGMHRKVFPLRAPIWG